MIYGQVLDFHFQSQTSSLEDLRRIHLLKTGQLIGLCLQGVGHIAGSSPEQIKDLKSIGLDIGLAFQIKDDLLDSDKDEAQSFLRFMSPQETQDRLQDLSESLLQRLAELSKDATTLQELVLYNQSRER